MDVNALSCSKTEKVPESRFFFMELDVNFSFRATIDTDIFFIMKLTSESSSIAVLDSVSGCFRCFSR